MPMFGFNWVMKYGPRGCNRATSGVAVTVCAGVVMVVPDHDGVGTVVLINCRRRVPTEIVRRHEIAGRIETEQMPASEVIAGVRTVDDTTSGVTTGEEDD